MDLEQPGSSSTKNQVSLSEKLDWKKWLFWFQDELRKLPQIEPEIKNSFSPGVYARTIYMPAGIYLIGKTHKTEHFNIAHTGMANVTIDGQTKLICGGEFFKSEPGSKKVFEIISAMKWTTIHPTEKTDIDEIEKDTVYTDEEEVLLMQSEIKELESQVSDLKLEVL
jgi:hypothetical protein